MSCIVRAALGFRFALVRRQRTRRLVLNAFCAAAIGALAAFASAPSQAATAPTTCDATTSSPTITFTAVNQTKRLCVTDPSMQFGLYARADADAGRGEPIDGSSSIMTTAVISTGSGTYTLVPVKGNAPIGHEFIDITLNAASRSSDFVSLYYFPGGVDGCIALTSCPVSARLLIRVNVPSAKQDQTISFTSTPPASPKVNGTYTPTATATSGLAVTFSIAPGSSAVCSISDGIVTFSSAGSCVVQANQAGDEFYKAAPQVTQTMSVTKSDQMIIFTSTPTGPPKVYERYIPTATAWSRLPVSFSIAPGSSAVCAISGAYVIFYAAGSCVIQADQEGDSAFNPAPQVKQILSVTRSDQSIRFTSTPPASAIVGGTYRPTATASSNLPVTFSIADLEGKSVCSISGGVVTFNAVGSCIVQADQGGDSAFNAATPKAQLIVVTKSDQRITFTSPPPISPQVGGTYTPTATADSKLTVAFSIAPSSASVCSITGGVVTFNAAGSCIVQADQRGDATFNAAPQVTQTMTVSKRYQWLGFTSSMPRSPKVGETYTPAASAESRLPVVFSVAPSSAGVCSILNGVVTFNAAGDCIVQADQAGDATFYPTQITQRMTVIKSDQTITFTSTPPAAPKINSTYTPTANASSKLAVAFSIAPASSAVCSISGGVVTFTGAGSCVLQADQSGDVAWNAAPQVTQTMSVTKSDQTITFTSTPPASPKVGGTYTPTATADSKLTVAFSIAPASSAVCSLTGGVVTFNATGSCVVQADQAGDGAFNAAPRVTQTMTVEKATPSVSVQASAPTAFFGAPVTLTATVSGGVSPSGSVTFKNGSTVLGTSPLSGSAASLTLSSLPVGANAITATYNGDARNAAITSAAATVTINARPDPSRERNVRALVTAQISAATRAAQSSMDAVNQRLISLHEDEEGGGAQTPLAFAPGEQGGRNQPPPAGAAGGAGRVGANPASGAAGPPWGARNGAAFVNRDGMAPGPRDELDQMAGPGAPPPASLMGGRTPLDDRFMQQALPGQALAYAPFGGAPPGQGDGARAVQTLAAGVPMAFQALDRNGALPFSVWGAGYVGLGRTRADGSYDNRFNGAGMTIGADGRLTADLNVGLALGLATSDTSIGADGSNTLMNSFTGTLYASYRVMAKTYIDASAGGGLLSSDNNRFSTAGGVMLQGKRDGHVVFGSLGLTRVAAWDRWKASGYARLDLINVTLDAYRESGSPLWALAYGKVDSLTTAGVAGARVSYGIPVSWGLFSPMARLEYRHVFESGFSQALNYVDLAALPGYRLDGSALARSTMTGALGFRAEAMDGFMFELEYLLSASADRVEAHRLRAMARMKF